MRGLLTTAVALAALVPPGMAFAQDEEAPRAETVTAPESPETGDAGQPVPDETASGGDIYTPEDFARFAPRSALDMLRQVPGFTIISQDQGRGLGQANDNVIVNGVSWE